MTPTRPDREGLELRNVDANYPFEKSHGFPGIGPNSGQRDYSRLSCGGGKRGLGPVAGDLGRRAAVIDLRR